MVTVIIINGHQHHGVDGAHVVTLSLLDRMSWEYACSTSYSCVWLMAKIVQGMLHSTVSNPHELRMTSQ